MSEPNETRPGISRRTVLRGAAVAGAAAAGGVLSAGSAEASPGRGGHGTEGSFRADLILHNGRIHTWTTRDTRWSAWSRSARAGSCYAATTSARPSTQFEDKPRLHRPARADRRSPASSTTTTTSC